MKAKQTVSSTIGTGATCSAGGKEKKTLNTNKHKNPFSLRTPWY
jgi:hypothetical protein